MSETANNDHGDIVYPRIYATTLDDLSKEQQSEILRELEEEKEEMMKLVLAHFLKRKSNAIKKKQKPDNIELSASEGAKAMFDFSSAEGPIVLPYEFRAKEDDEHLDQQSTVRQGSCSDEHEEPPNHEDELDSNQRMMQDIVQVKNSPCLSNTSVKLLAGHNSAMTTSLIKEIDLVRLRRKSTQCRREAIRQGSKSGCRNLEVLRKVPQYMGEVAYRNLPKGSGGNNSKLGVLKTVQLGLSISKIEKKPRHQLGLSNWQKRKLEKLSAQELKKSSMAWVPKRRVQFQGKDDANAEGVAKTKESQQTHKELLSQSDHVQKNHLRRPIFTGVDEDLHNVYMD
uniref:Uncharacterized protein n=1 Tax=Leersia perrieri TaxID=77586 RepID=A0A0D9XZ01_9ORYZ